MLRPRLEEEMTGERQGGHEPLAGSDALQFCMGQSRAQRLLCLRKATDVSERGAGRATEASGAAGWHGCQREGAHSSFRPLLSMENGPKLNKGKF